MNSQQSVAGDIVSGFPSFVRWSGENPLILDWWCPAVIGDPRLDYAAGEAHLESAFDLFPNFRDRSKSNFYRAMVTPLFENPASVLSGILSSMRVSGPIECGFVEALTRKAMAGRAPSINPYLDLSDDDQLAEQHAHACLEVSRLLNMPHLVSDELICIIDQTFDVGAASAFLSVICGAAVAGALH